MPDARLQRTRDAYESAVAFRLRTIVHDASGSLWELAQTSGILPQLYDNVKKSTPKKPRKR